MMASCQGKESKAHDLRAIRGKKISENNHNDEEERGRKEAAFMPSKGRRSHQRGRYLQKGEISGSCRAWSKGKRRNESGGEKRGKVLQHQANSVRSPAFLKKRDGSGLSAQKRKKRPWDPIEKEKRGKYAEAHKRKKKESCNAISTKKKEGAHAEANLKQFKEGKHQSLNGLPPREDAQSWRSVVKKKKRRTGSSRRTHGKGRKSDYSRRSPILAGPGGKKKGRRRWRSQKKK